MLAALQHRLVLALASTALSLGCAAERGAYPPEVLNEPPNGYEALFNGSDLNGWWGLGTEDPAAIAALAPAELSTQRAAGRRDIEQHWRVDDGELVNDGEGLFLTTEREFRDFELLVEYATVPGADSGIYLRGIPQVQIWDTTEAGGKWELGADRGSGGLWNNTQDRPGRDPLVHADRAFGEWNQLRILMIGEWVTVELNGALVVDAARLENYFDRQAPLPLRGPIQLQTHGGEIRWRNIFVREVESKEANAFLRARASDGFTSIFNGHNLDGWSGPVENYEVREASLVCREGHGGTIFTEQIFSDFAVRMEFLLPPGGNNGLAIRYPGQGDTAYVGMCELQVLDDTDEKYANLDPRQYHGSVYGLVAAHRGYLRERGQWNFQQVTVEGSRIRVELNGTRILDAEDDTDGNGIPALIEKAFAIGEEGSQGGLPTTYTGDNPSDSKAYLMVNYHRRIQPGGFRYLVETSTNMDDWSAIEGDIEVLGTTPNGDGLTETCVLRIHPAIGDIDGKFVRVRVELD